MTTVVYNNPASVNMVELTAAEYLSPVCESKQEWPTSLLLMSHVSQNFSLLDLHLPDLKKNESPTINKSVEFYHPTNAIQ